MINQREQAGLREISWIRPIDEVCIKAYLQGAVYCWCKNHRVGEGSEHFSARTFLGEVNFYWEGTPLYILYAYHFHECGDPESARKKAAVDAGYLLKAVIEEDKRTYDTDIEGLVRAYWWDGGEKEEFEDIPLYVSAVNN